MPAEGVSYYLITPAEAGQRIDNFLFTRLKGVPKTRLYRALRRGEVRVNRGRVKPPYQLRPGDQVRLPPLRVSAEKPAPPPLPEPQVLYEDDALLVIDKSAGLAVHGGSGIAAGLIERLRVTRKADYLQLAHRLDRATSGCLVLAKSRIALLDLHAQLKTRALSRRYLALVAGSCRAQSIKLPLGVRMEGGRKRIVADPQGRPAQTDIEPVSHGPDWTLIRARLITGRMHQVRVHTAAIGHPVAGDPIYGDPQVNEAWQAAGGERLFLHAEQVSLKHPNTGRPLTLEAPLPEELAAPLNDDKETRRQDDKD